MQKLLEGIQRFQQDVFRAKQPLFESLVEGQHPLALFITCADSRIDPCLLTQTDPGELFILRNAGNIVPPYGAVDGGESATIEYAVGVLGIKDIIICGHSHCGAMGGLLDLEHLTELPAVRSWLSHAESTLRIVEEGHAEITDPQERLRTTVEQNVLVQLDNLRTHPTVASALSRKAIQLHGWVYNFESGKVLAYHPRDERFVPLEQTNFSV